VDGHIKPNEIIRVVNDPGWIAMTKFYRDGALGREHWIAVLIFSHCSTQKEIQANSSLNRIANLILVKATSIRL
jgi:hypothetical protein